MARASGVTPDHFTSFGQLLKHLRRRAGLTQRELSIAVGYSDSQISRLEGGLRVPDQATLTARFVPALHLENEPEVVARLLELAKAWGPASDLPSTMALENPRNNLPAHLTSFIGREPDIAEVRRLLSVHRLVTLTGAGGSGKTRLALQAAQTLATDFRDGVWLVELAALAEPALVPQAAAAVLDVREQPGRQLTESLVNYLRARRMLLVLDNCEHLIGACAELAESLLRACPHLRLLATSREGLGIAGETVWLVPSLSLPEPRQLSLGANEALGGVRQSEAGRLFMERAVAARPAFSLTPDNAPAVAQICERLDGIPLAIELAAARLRAMSVDQIAARLHDRFRLLTDGGRTALPRHQTLWALIDWSYMLLSEAERALLRRLAVFRAGWTLEAVEAVCVATGIEEKDMLDLVTRLVDKSLVEFVDQGGAARYRMLETIRQYAGVKLLEAGEHELVGRRHFDYYLQMAEAAESKERGPENMALMNRLETEHDNLRAALAWTVESAGDAEAGLRLATALVHVFWYMHGYFGEGREWLTKILALPGAPPRRALRARVLAEAGLLAYLQGDFERGQALGDESLAQCHQLASTLGIAGLLVGLKATKPTKGMHRRGKALRKMRPTSPEHTRDKEDLTHTLDDLGIGAYYHGDYPRAQALSEVCVTLSQELGNSRQNAYSRALLGWSALYQGDYERAQASLEEALIPLREMGEMVGSADALWGLGYAARMRGDGAQATALFREGLTMSRATGYKWNIAACLDGLARVAGTPGRTKPSTLALEELRRAARLFGAAEALREIIGSPLPPAERGDHDRSVAAVRAQLDGAAFAAAWAEGRAMTLDEAVEYALEVTRR